MEIIIDTREKSLQELINQKYPDHSHTRPLEIGDIEIKWPTSDGPRYIFERKTIADLASSIKDGRYREQRARLLSAIPAYRITYIIEGSVTTETAHGLKKDIYNGVYYSLMYRDHIHVVFVKDTNATADWICNFFKKALANPDKYADPATGASSSYCDSLKLKSQKQANITPDICYRMMISQIPGVSIKIAETIAEVYPNMRSLMSASLQDLIKLPLIGKKKAQVIMDFLLT